MLGLFGKGLIQQRRSKCYSEQERQNVNQSEFVVCKCLQYGHQLTITRRHILDWSKLKQSADNNSTSDENSKIL